jgi:hypothetical protein
VRDGDGTITNFEIPNTTDTRAIGINNRGQVSGMTGFIHGFIRDVDGTFTIFDAPGLLTECLHINDLGQVTGGFYDGVSFRGYIRETSGEFTIFDVPGYIDPEGYGINNNEVVVGAAGDANFNGHGFVRNRNGEFTILDVPGATDTGPFAINDRGHIAGSYDDATGGHGFVAIPVH